MSYHLRQQQGALPVHHKKIFQTYCATYFQNKCIFCDKEVKYVKRKSKFPRKCAVEQGKSKTLHHAKENNCFHLTVFASTNHLTAAKAQYHSSRYTNYTRPVTGKKVIEKSDYQKLELETFQEVVKHCHDIICSSSILKFEELL